MSDRTHALPKAELHCHLEGTLPPRLVRRLAQKNRIELPEGLFDAEGEFAWQSFVEFLNAYDLAAGCLRSGEDYHLMTYAYLERCAAEGAIYVELFASPDHAAAVGIGYDEMLAGCVAAIEAAEREFGIVGRIIITCVRHLGPERARVVAEKMIAEPHPFVVGFGMGGDENRFEPADFAPAFWLAAEAGYGCTAHAGEVRGPQSVWDCLRALPVTRIGHGVRSVEDPWLVETLALKGIHLEVCPGSNLALGLYHSLAAHPFPDLRSAGCSLSLGSDDPPFFHTSIGDEYARVAEGYQLDEPDLLELTRMALQAAFADQALKTRLLQRLESR